MPSIKDESTVDAIAREFCSNGRNKEGAMRTIGYAESSCKSGKAVKDVYGNLRVGAAIARIDAVSAQKAELTIAEVLEDLAYGMTQARKDNDLPAIARFSELRGKYLSMYSAEGNNAATGLNLNFTTKPLKAKTG